jgi:seryl-tRNA synthetase
MATEHNSLDLRSVAGITCLDNGQVALTGPALRLFQRLDCLFASWAREFAADDHLFPAFISARELGKLDYFRSFPHLVTLPVTLSDSDDNLRNFIDGRPLDTDACLNLPTLSPVKEVLTPAACYHVYVALQGRSLNSPVFVTTRAACFRREREYLPLRRQWSFSMREIVCIGTAGEVKTFLKAARERVASFLSEFHLPITWQNATDPFFNPSRNPRFLMQKLDPVKTEMIFGDWLAIGSVNFHRNYFGEAFRIVRKGDDAYSGCIAFGLERWMYAFLHHFGTNEAAWPLPALKESNNGRR